ncbi:hypothetical protein ACHAXT_009269 [Thalassiosira profunda]
MNAAVSKALPAARRALSAGLPRRCTPSKLALARGRSFASSDIVEAPVASVHLTSLHSQLPHPRHRPLPRHPAPAPPSQQRRSLFIQTATTPNPESLKFIPNGRLVLGQTESVDTADPAQGEIEIDHDEGSSSNDNNQGVYLTRKDHTLIARSPLAKVLFNLDLGIKSIYLGYDFITVTKYAEAHWSHLQTPIFGAIMDFYATGEPALRDVPEITDTTILDDDDEVVAMIKELLETRIRPAVQEDGGDIRYVGFEESDGVVTVQLAGSCVGCPSSSVTLKNGVENMLMHYIPEVAGVVALEEEEDDGYEGSGGGEGEVVVEQSGEEKKMKTYQERLAAAGIPFSD